MGYYGVANSKDEMMRLIDRALAGEEVVITLDGKPTATIRPFESAKRPTPAAAMERLRQLREAGPKVDISAVDLVRQMRDEGF